MQVHDAEVLLKEKYGTHPGDRYYVKPPDQGNVVIVDEGISRNFLAWLPEHVLLPQGYPDSVSKDYTAYQIWDTAQAFCSTIMGTLATQEVLRGMGVGNDAATPMAATVTWVLKDGCGHIGRILFAYSHGTHLDAYSKKWRLYADVLNDAAMCIEMALPALNYTTLFLCISTSMKAIVGVAGGATRIALTQHHALRNNLADVSAKDAAQETAVNLLASCFALTCLSMIGNQVPLFLLLMFLHITFNYMAVRAVCLRTLNEPRYLQVIYGYVRHEVISSPCTVNHNEPLFFYQMGVNCLDYKVCGFSIKMGQSIRKVTKLNPNSQFFRQLIEVYKNRNYLLYPCIPKRQMFVMIREHATVDDVLRAYFHAVLLSAIICAINNASLGVYAYAENRRPFAEVCRALQMADWSREDINRRATRIGDSDFCFNSSPALMAFVDTMVHKEWQRFRAGLITAGWDPTKHLLLLNEWRVTSHTVTPKKVSISDNVKDTTDTALKTLVDVDKYLNDVEVEEKEAKARKELLRKSEQTSEKESLKEVKEPYQARMESQTYKEKTLEEEKVVHEPEQDVYGPDSAGITDTKEGHYKGKTKASLNDTSSEATTYMTPTPTPSKAYVGDLQKIFSNECQITDSNIQDPFNLIKKEQARKKDAITEEEA